MIQQSGAVPIRFNDEPLFLVINNMNRTRWLVPKGVVENGHTSAGTAAKEAMEEAGVAGEILERQPLGVYTYPKWGDICTVDLYVMFVTQIHDTWEEDHFRERRWIGWDEFFKTVDERIPRSLLEKIPEVLKAYPRKQRTEGIWG
jgi:8-oxo-dGTP pyrophosphatase MutT (NUDIX family)